MFAFEGVVESEIKDYSGVVHATTIGGYAGKDERGEFVMLTDPKPNFTLVSKGSVVPSNVIGCPVAIFD